jgi:predicted nucleic acid-binding protein
MSAIYIETSAVLTWLLGEPQSRRVVDAINASVAVVTSVITILETRRSLLRAERQQVISPADGQRLTGLFSNTILGWSFLEITAEIRDRASMPFPTEPVRSLDAVHLASMLEFLLIYPELRVLSYDRRILENILPLGLVFAD